MISLSLLDILLYLLSAARWTLYLSAMAFVGGGLGAFLLLAVRFAYPVVGARFASLFTELFQGTPLLLQLFIVFFGLPVLGFDVPPAVAAGVALSLYASAYLADIWRGCIEAIPRGQWDAAAGLGMTLVTQMRDVILPQAASIAIPPTVGFLVQLIKATALASIVGYDELMRAGQIITNAIFQPFLVYGLVALVYFAMCFPLTIGARLLERRLSRGRVKLAEGKT
jgi:polar amino acid transport system permease protein